MLGLGDAFILILLCRKTSYSMPKSPRRVTACGFQTGLTVLVRPMMNDYHTTFFSSYGIRVGARCLDAAVHTLH